MKSKQSAWKYVEVKRIGKSSILIKTKRGRNKVKTDRKEEKGAKFEIWGIEEENAGRQEEV